MASLFKDLPTPQKIVKAVGKHLAKDDAKVVSHQEFCRGLKQAVKAVKSKLETGGDWEEDWCSAAAKSGEGKSQLHRFTKAISVSTFSSIMRAQD